jgi:hypothetical protein
VTLSGMAFLGGVLVSVRVLAVEGVEGIPFGVLVLALPFLGLGVGLLRRRWWAWWLGIGLSAAGLLSGVWGLLTGDQSRPGFVAGLLVTLMPSGLLLCYLMLPGVRRSLQRPRPDADA